MENNILFQGKANENQTNMWRSKKHFYTLHFMERAHQENDFGLRGEASFSCKELYDHTWISKNIYFGDCIILLNWFSYLFSENDYLYFSTFIKMVN